MPRIFVFIFLIFVVLVFFNYAATFLANTFGSYSPFPAPFGFSFFSSGLSAVDLTTFGIGGKGRDYITQGYGSTPYSYMYVNHWHNGIDIAARYGAPIYSPSDAVVLAVGNQDNFCPGKGFGRYVATRNSSGDVVLWYAHLGTISVSPGDTMKKGAEIGAVGNSGLETGTHLHLSVFNASGFSMKPKNGCGPDADGRDINPLSYLAAVH